MQLGAFPLPANQSVTATSREGLIEVRNDTRVGLALVLNRSLTCCRPHPDRAPARHSGLLKAPVEISSMPRFTLVEGNGLYPSAKLSDYRKSLVNSSTCVHMQAIVALQIARRLQVFFSFFKIWFISTEPLETQAPPYTFRF